MRGITNVIFFPGASGASEFWRPVAKRLPALWSKTLLSWPGAGDQPHDPLVRGYEDLVELAASQLGEESDMVAQSMRGVIAVGRTLRYPERVGRIVLATTSGGIEVAGLGGADWRDEYRAEFPRAAPWVWRHRVDYTDRIRAVNAADVPDLGRRRSDQPGLGRTAAR